MYPDWLSAPLSLAGSSYDDNIEELYSVYERDFVNSAPAIVDSYKVLVTTRLDPSWDEKYPHGFTHIITRGGSHRGIDFDRAKKLPWVRSILDNYTQKEVSAFWASTIKGDRLYLWLEEYDFVIILSPLVGKRASSASNRIIVSAYTVDPHRRYEFFRLRGRAIKTL